MHKKSEKKGLKCKFRVRMTCIKSVLFVYIIRGLLIQWVSTKNAIFLRPNMKFFFLFILFFRERETENGLSNSFFGYSIFQNSWVHLIYIDLGYIYTFRVYILRWCLFKVDKSFWKTAHESDTQYQCFSFHQNKLCSTYFCIFFFYLILCFSAIFSRLAQVCWSFASVFFFFPCRLCNHKAVILKCLWRQWSRALSDQINLKRECPSLPVRLEGKPHLEFQL